LFISEGIITNAKYLVTLYVYLQKMSYRPQRRVYQRSTTLQGVMGFGGGFGGSQLLEKKVDMEIRNPSVVSGCTENAQSELTAEK
jgi:hypothetical protein